MDKFLVCQKFFGAPHAHLSTDKKLSRDDLGVNPGENIFGAKFSISPYASVLVPDQGINRLTARQAPILDATAQSQGAFKYVMVASH